MRYESNRIFFYYSLRIELQKKILSIMWDLGWPTKEDLGTAASAIIRIQHVYDFNTSEVSHNSSKCCVDGMIIYYLFPACSSQRGKLEMLIRGCLCSLRTVMWLGDRLSLMVTLPWLLNGSKRQLGRLVETQRGTEFLEALLKITLILVQLL